jgi:MYXO-CTERM domain-containing protein
MDFIERLFGIAPDGGTGSLESLYILLAVLALAAIAGRRRLANLFRGPARRAPGKRG